MPALIGMASPFDLLALASAALTAFGLMVVASGAVAVHRFGTRPPHQLRHRPAVTVLKPLCGDEPLLESALASICAQSYPRFQIVFGVQDAQDPALLVVERLQRRFPACEIVVVTSGRLHGRNHKISNLINMMAAARHGVLVFSDSDLHVAPDYLDRIVAALDGPGVGLVTTVCAGLPTRFGLAARLGATAISHSFLPGALLSRALGREECLGNTMALRRDTLIRAGGLAALVGHLADDNVLGKRVQQLGLRIVLAATVPLVAVPEVSLGALWRHELRWARTIGALEPALFAFSTLQFPIFWAVAALLLSGGKIAFLALFAATWLLRAAAAHASDRRLLQGRGQSAAVTMWLLPLRDILSVVLVAASYAGVRVIWRGHVMRTDDGRFVRKIDAGLQP